MRIDLHCHSAASDGTEAPADVVRRARAAGVDVLALTDHDTVAGFPAASAALPTGLTLLPAMELSCALATGAGVRISLHLLALLFDPAEAELARECARLRDDRIGRARAMVERVRHHDDRVTWDAVARLAGDGVVGRPHVARAMAEAGVVASPAEAFSDDWIGAGGRCYVPKHALDPARAVALVRRAGGVAVLAHPSARGPVVPDEVIAGLAAAGLTGLEVDHPDHPAPERTRLRELAADLGLLVTGGSDDHGALTGHRLGCEATAPEALAALRAAASGAEPVVA